MSRRTERIAEQLRSEIAAAIRNDVTDPRVGLVTITWIDVSPDMSHALIYWSGLGVDDDEGIASIGEGLASCAGHLRSRIAKRLSLRRMPEFRFRHDRSIERGSHVLEVLEEVVDGESA
ncbi:MAG: 30S ribosome-binding factor RbfA [bacterium]|nr:30S ribosome-binding factor RbfA [bacterium]